MIVKAIWGNENDIRLIEFTIKSTSVRFQNVTLKGSTNLCFPFRPDAEIIFNDTREIDNLIYMLEELKRTNDDYIGRFERV